MKYKIVVVVIIILILMVGFACQLTSPTPASWAGTPTAKARALTTTAIVLTQEALPDEEFILTSTPSILESLTTETSTPGIPEDGPWLVYPAQEGTGLHAFDIEARTVASIDLPSPIYWADLITGLSPDGRRLIMRAGSPMETDALALYEIDVKSMTIRKITPLLSLLLQRNIVNEVGTRAFDVFEVVTRSDGLAWSPDSRYLAFSAALDNQSSDLYVFDSLNDRVSRANGLSTYNATPMWGLDNNRLVSQELGKSITGEGWRSENVTGITVPGFDDQNTYYLPSTGSQEEVFVGWLNSQNFISYSLTAEGPNKLRRVNVESFDYSVILQGSFEGVAVDPIYHSIALILSDEEATPVGKVEGLYLLNLEDIDFQLHRGGFWTDLSWDSGGLFLAKGSQGLYAFRADGQSMMLPEEKTADLSPVGNWMIAWGDGETTKAGARLYQPPSIHPLQNLTDDHIETVFWQPDSKAFFILSKGTIYRLSFPDLHFSLVEDGFTEDESLIMGWMLGDS